jgi:putative transport protein
MLQNIIGVLRDNPILLLFVVAGIGYPLGRIKIGSASFGVAAVLFIGLLIGGLDPSLKLPPFVNELGLVLFVYTMGLASGSMFFESLRRKGLSNNLLVIVSILFGAILAFAVAKLFGIEETYASGMFSGSLTSTPALAGVLEYLRAIAPSEILDALQAEPVIGYSLAYPVGILGMILTIIVMQRVLKVDYKKEAEAMSGDIGVNQPLINKTIRVSDNWTHSLQELVVEKHWNVIFGRVKRGDQWILATGETVLKSGDIVNLVGIRQELERVITEIGELSEEQVQFDLQKYDERRFFISNLDVAGRRLRHLHLYNTFGAIVSRIRRGDVELLPHGETMLELGDQVRVIAPSERMEEISVFLGDSYRGISEINLFSFSLGLALGLLVGLIPIPLPGGIVFRLGIAGGPLLVSLVLGALGRTGPFVWQVPYSVNLALRQLGLVFFLAGVGTRAGYDFINTLAAGQGLDIFIGGVLITCGVSVFGILVGYKLMKLPLSLIIGILAGVNTQPAVLAFALEQTDNDLPTVGYSVVFPASMIAKIIMAQVLLLVLQ